MNHDFSDFMNLEPYCLDFKEKDEYLTDYLKQLTLNHYNKCIEYRNILNSIDFNINSVKSYYDIPFIPVRLFKELEMKSCKSEEIIKTMTSSGTSGQKVSKIYLDKFTAIRQQQVMTKIVSNFLGKSRLPMIIIDSPAVIKNRNLFSARGAGILGFSLFGTDKIYALNEDMSLNQEGIRMFLEKHKGENIFLFGFTFMIWQHFYQELVKLGRNAFHFSNGIMIHGGGWKKLISQAVSPKEFNLMLKQVCGIDRVYNYYGMVEQTGCIYMECEYGHLHASVFSDVIIRRKNDFSVCDIGENGIIEVVSTLASSYPGHALLTEDEGIILGVDDCPCGRKGKYFSVSGRIKNAEIRGCSDTYASSY